MINVMKNQMSTKQEDSKSVNQENSLVVDTSYIQKLWKNIFA